MDLNLLRVFDAVVRTGSVTAAADSLHMTTPATSRALARLRVATGDEIMVRAGRGLVPTPYATRNAASVRRMLDEADQLLGDRGGDDPALWQRVFTIRINDALVPIVAPHLIAQAQHEAPQVELRFVAEGKEDLESLRDGSIDLDIGATGANANDIRQTDLATDHYVAVTSRKTVHDEDWSLDTFCRLPHVIASRRTRTFGPIDSALADLGRRRQIAAIVPTLPTAAVLALRDGLIAPIPSLLAAQLHQVGLPLAIYAIPFRLPPLQLSQHWHRRSDADTAARWLRGAVVQAFSASR